MIKSPEGRGQLGGNKTCEWHLCRSTDLLISPMLGCQCLDIAMVHLYNLSCAYAQVYLYWHQWGLVSSLRCLWPGDLLCKHTTLLMIPKRNKTRIIRLCSGLEGMFCSYDLFKLYLLWMWFSYWLETYRMGPMITPPQFIISSLSHFLTSKYCDVIILRNW